MNVRIDVQMTSHKLLEACPHLIPSSSTMLAYDGFINISGKDFRVHISVPSHDKLHHARINCDWHLSHMMQGYQDVIRKLLQQSKNLPDFIIEFKNLLNKIAECNHVIKSAPPPSYYKHLLEEFDKLGWDRITHIDENFTTVNIKSCDRGGREHSLIVHIPQKYPVTSPTCIADLPVAFEPHWGSEDSMVTLLKAFELELDKYQLFWDIVDELDHETHVLEPEAPTRASNTRRIFIASNVSIYLVIDPVHPNSFPECRFLGQDSATEVFRRRLNTELHMWDLNESILVNLSAILEITFPPKPSQLQEEQPQQQVVMECCICYCYRLDGAVPDVVCNNDQCSQAFHHACLFEWLKSVPTSRQSFNTIFGECPYCSRAISVQSL